MTSERHAIFGITDSANSRGTSTGAANTDVRNRNTRKDHNSSLVSSSPVHKTPEQERGKRTPTQPPPFVRQKTRRQTRRPA